MKRRFSLLLAMLTVAAFVVAAVGVTSAGAAKKGSEGCTPGYWKQSQHFDSWPSDFGPNSLFFGGFENAFPGKTLLQVLSQPASTGGQNALNNLGRHAVAALLNAYSDGVDYPISATDVINQFNAVFPGTDAAYEAQKNIFAGFNELGCPLS